MKNGDRAVIDYLTQSRDVLQAAIDDPPSPARSRQSSSG
jgi:hypothetical protein